jgi:HEAT repeat protein
VTHYGPTTTGTKKGSKLLTAVLVIVLLAVVGGATVFWTDRDALIKHVKDADHLAVPACIVIRLQGKPPAELEEPLCALLHHQEPRLRAEAARTLGHYKSRGLVVNLGNAATADAEPAVRAAAVEGLEVTAETNAIPYVRQALNDPAATVRAAACSAVGAYQLSDCIPTLIAYLEDQDVELHTAAKRALDTFLTENEESMELDRHRWQLWYESRGG